MRRGLWWVALGLSLLLHLLLLAGSAYFEPSASSPPLRRLEARLVAKPPPAIHAAPALAAAAPKPAPAPPPAVRAREKPPAQPLPKTSEAPLGKPHEEVAPTNAGERSEVPDAVAQATPPPAEPAVNASLDWARQGRIRFEVFTGEGERAMLVGASTHHWEHDGEHYRIHTSSETIGLIALFHSAQIEQTSRGRLGPNGLIPEEFTAEQRNKALEQARFDWSQGRIAFYKGERLHHEEALLPGSQDLLSQVYQISLGGIAAQDGLMIATAKSYGRHDFALIGEEELETRFGVLDTWHLKSTSGRGEQTMDLWLASHYDNLPVRIRYVNRRGEIFDQRATDIEVDGARLERP